MSDNNGSNELTSNSDASSDSDSNKVSSVVPQIESFDSVQTNNSDSDEDILPDRSGADIKIKPLKIMKINVNNFNENKADEREIHQEAESTIEQMVGKRPRSDEDATEPPKKKRRNGIAKASIPSNAAAGRIQFDDKLYKKRTLFEIRNPERTECCR